MSAVKSQSLVSGWPEVLPGPLVFSRRSLENGKTISCEVPHTVSTHAQRGSSQPRIGRHSRQSRLPSFAFYEAVQTPGGGIPLLKGVGGSFLPWELLCLVAGPGRDPKTYPFPL